MFVRFVVDEIDPDSHCRVGVFRVAYRLRSAPHVTGYDAERLAAALSWFGENLATPDRFSRSRRSDGAREGICWFKPSAAEHLGRVREIADVVETYGVRIEMITSRRPGYITYEDAHQVVAAPFRETRT